MPTCPKCRTTLNAGNTKCPGCGHRSDSVLNGGEPMLTLRSFNNFVLVAVIVVTCLLGAMNLFVSLREGSVEPLLGAGVCYVIALVVIRVFNQSVN